MESTKSSRILELAETISKYSSTIHQFLDENNLPFPSFSADGTTGIPAQLSEAQDAIIDATTELRDLLVPPRTNLYHYGAENNLVSLQAIARFDIASKVPLNSDGISYKELASQLGLDGQILRRLIRHATTMRVFAEHRHEFVSHTAISKALLDPNMRAWLKTGSNELWPASTKVVDALTKWPGSGEPTETGFALADGTSRSIYQVLATEPQRLADFAAAMNAFATTPEMSMDYLTSHPVWKKTKSVVDIGGSTGQAAIALTQKHPQLHVTVEDLPPVVSGAEQHVPQEVASRIKFTGYDFSVENAVQPVKGADVYLMRWVLHNWSDKYATGILRSIIPALNVGAKILIMEIIVPEPGTVPQWKEKNLRAMDLEMLCLFNAPERSLHDWKELLRAADPRFSLVGVSEPQGSTLGLLEVEWAPK